MFSAGRLCVGDTLTATIITSNCIESMILDRQADDTPSDEVEGRLDEQAPGRP